MFKELGLCSYRVECSLESKQETVQVSEALVGLPAPCSFLAAWAMYRIRQRVGFNCYISPPDRLYRSRHRGPLYCYLTSFFPAELLKSMEVKPKKKRKVFFCCT